ncbi:MAG: hypothetical protein QXO94_07020 [Candidatus Bathyarchaeia archaeon]
MVRKRGRKSIAEAGLRRAFAYDFAPGFRRTGLQDALFLEVASGVANNKEVHP